MANGNSPNEGLSMTPNITVIDSKRREDTTLLQFETVEWTWDDFDKATEEAFKRSESGRCFIISNLLQNGGYLPKGRTALEAANKVRKTMPHTVRYWVIVGPMPVQSTLAVTRRIFPRVRYVGAAN